MKHQEFFTVPNSQICLSQGISEHAVHNVNCLIVDNTKDWSPLILKLIQDTELRKKIAINGRIMCREHYTFKGQWPHARKALLEFD